MLTIVQSIYLSLSLSLSLSSCLCLSVSVGFNHFECVCIGHVRSSALNVFPLLTRMKDDISIFRYVVVVVVVATVNCVGVQLNYCSQCTHSHCLLYSPLFLLLIAPTPTPSLSLSLCYHKYEILSLPA